jgi:hypothetical protein
MTTDLSEYLSSIPKRTRTWVHQHVVPDTKGPGGKMYPTPANRAERRRAGRPGGVNGWFATAVTTPYEKEHSSDAGTRD